MIAITVCAGQNKIQKSRSTTSADQRPSYNQKAVEHFIRGSIS